MDFVDTHCHIHEAQYKLQGDNGVRSKWLESGKPDPDDMLAEAASLGVKRTICVGTTANDSELAVSFVQSRKNTWASIGIHPHEAKGHVHDINKLQQFRNLLKLKNNKVVAIGECGLDYFYKHSPKNDQIKLLEFQLQLAQENKLPVIFHVRSAFDDFWPILDNFKDLRGVLHSYTDTKANLDKALNRGLYIGLNGIMTFTKDADQLDMAKTVPLKSLVLETDAPFLTPTPERGKICQPKHLVLTAEFLGKLRGESLENLARQTTANATQLFGI